MDVHLVSHGAHAVGQPPQWGRGCAAGPVGGISGNCPARGTCFGSPRRFLSENKILPVVHTQRKIHGEKKSEKNCRPSANRGPGTSPIRPKTSRKAFFCGRFNFQPHSSPSGFGGGGVGKLENMPRSFNDSWGGKGHFGKFLGGCHICFQYECRPYLHLNSARKRLSIRNIAF